MWSYKDLFTWFIGIGMFCFCLIFIFVGYKSYKGATRKFVPGAKASNADKRMQLKQKHNAQEITLVARDGMSLQALYIHRHQAKRMFLVVHGYGQAKEKYDIIADVFPNDTLLLLDLRAHGESKGHLISYGYFESLDAQAGYDFLSNQYRSSQVIPPVIAIGFSMGAVALAKSVYDGTPFDALILDCPYSNLKVQMDRFFSRVTGLHKVFNALGRGFYRIGTGTFAHELDVAQLLKGASIPILCIHSQEDRVTPVEDAHTIYAAVKQNNDAAFLWICPTGKHAAVIHETPDAYKKRVDEFLETAKL